MPSSAEPLVTRVQRPVRVTSASEAAARDADAIASGVESFALMAAAGTVAAAEVLRAAGDAVAHGVTVWCGGGNNGGDGYIVAAQLARLGVRVVVIAVAPARTADAVRAASLARAARVPILERVETSASAPPGVIVDALLGTGAAGPLRDEVAHATAAIRRARDAGACIIALDVPTGVNATTGARVEGAVRAHTTITFGTCKRGLLAARDLAGRIVVADIGLDAHAARADDAALLADASVLRHVVPPVRWDAHKGTRGRVLVIGGAAGMAGAAQFVARGALASGAGLVRALVHTESRAALQAAVPAVVCVPDEVPLVESLAWAHAVVLGPGLGRDATAHARVREVLEGVRDLGSLVPSTHTRRGASQAAAFLAPRRPVLVLDADALVVASDAELWPLLVACAERTPTVLTPHAGEFAALAAMNDIPWRASDDDVSARLTAARALAAASGAHVLLKGAPTCCAAPDGTTWWVPRGSATLATGGTGDVLSGVLGALAAQVRADGSLATNELTALAASAAWVHGVAGEHVCPTRDVRGVSVDDVIDALGAAWSRLRTEAPVSPGVLAELPAVVPASG